MPVSHLGYQLKGENRHFIRNEMISEFLKESPGTDTEDLSSKYIYHVETFSHYEIVLIRPAYLNKGFDFIVSIESPYQYLFKGKTKRYNNPSHDDIENALLYCQANFPENYPKIRQILIDLYNCKQVKLASYSLGNFIDYNNNIHPIEIIILSIKWLFIEQDITYWNWSGRSMLFEKLSDKLLV